MEQIDVAHLLIQKYPDVCYVYDYIHWLYLIKELSQTFKFATSTEDIYEAIATHKIASMLGVEGFVFSCQLLKNFRYYC